MRVAVKTVARDVELPQLLITVAFRCPRCQQIITAESTQEATENQKPKLIITGET